MQNVRAAAPWNRQSFEHDFETPSFTIKSIAMPGFTLKVWRTDHGYLPPSAEDVRFMATHAWSKHKVNHVRNEWSKPHTSYDIIVQTLPTIPEVPQVVVSQHEELRPQSPTATPHNSPRPA